MSTCRTLIDVGMTLSERFTVSTPYKRVSMRTCCRSTDETHHRIPQQVSWQRVPLKLAGKVNPNLQSKRRNPKIIGKKNKENWAKQVLLFLCSIGELGEGPQLPRHGIKTIHLIMKYTLARDFTPNNLRIKRVSNVVFWII